jgi:phage terminase large subunit-like protein
VTKEEKLHLISLLEEKKRRERFRLIDSYFPETGPLRRELYHKHMQFFELGTSFEERLALAANRVGKTETMGGYELTCHLTGLYPKWWKGRTFDKPIEAWAAGKTGQTVRDIIQRKLLGPKTDIGTGLIKGDLILSKTTRHGIPDAVDTVFVKHTSGGTSELGFKSYDQKRQSFEGTKKDVIWLDEECPLDIYTECLLRTTDTSGKAQKNGILMITFTPLLGMSEVVMQFLPSGQIEEKKEGAKAVVMATWDDAPHLTEETKAKLLSSIPPFQRDARSKGVPQLGSGAIYPVPESDFVVQDFPIPEHWPRVYGLDVGWNKTAAVFGAIDRETDTLYLYSEHYRGQAEPIIHAQSIKAPGEWIPGVIDPASRGRGQKDGAQLLQTYLDLGLDIETAFNGVESGIYEVWQRLSSGRLKVFKSMSNWLSEFRLYRRDERGRIVKENDHLMDASRYLVMSGLDRAKTLIKKKPENIEYLSGSQNTGWMG